MSRIAILSDIHGNLFALERVVQDMDSRCIDQAILLGDLIDYGMQSNEVVAYIMNHFHYPLICNIWGNHEKAILTSDFNGFSSQRGVDCAKHTASLLTPETTDYLNRELIHDGPLLLNSIANGPFCGGGIKSNPTAKVDDGLMDVNVVKDVSRTYFLKLFPQYQKGTHMSMPNIDRTIKTARCRMLKITPKSEGARLCIDGEMTDAGEITITMKEKAFRFLAP